jgi:hypothetical protein
MNVMMTMEGNTIVISPVFNGACEPAYWEVSINDRVVWRTFASPKQAMRFVESLYKDTSGGLTTTGVFAPFLSDV